MLCLIYSLKDAVVGKEYGPTKSLWRSCEVALFSGGFHKSAELLCRKMERNPQESAHMAFFILTLL